MHPNVLFHHLTNYHPFETIEFTATQDQYDLQNHHHKHRQLGESTVSDPNTGVSNPFMSALCADFIDDPQVLVTVKFFSIVMVVRNEKKSGVLASVSAFICCRTAICVYSSFMNLF